MCRIHNKSSNFIPNTNQPAISPRQSKNWSKASKKATSSRHYWVLQDPGRPLPWQTLLLSLTNQPWYLRTIKHLQPSCMVSLRNSSLRTQWNTLSPTTTTTSRRLTSRQQTPTLPKMLPPTTRSISFVFLPQQPYASERM